MNEFNPDWLCTCGDLTVLGVVHSKTDPCYTPVKRDFVSLTQSEWWDYFNTVVDKDLNNVELFFKLVDDLLWEKNR